MDQEEVFCEGFDGKEAFLNDNNIGSKATKICIFSTGLVHGFCEKMEILLTFVFMQNGSRKRVL